MIVELSIGKITCTKDTLSHLATIMAIYADVMEDSNCNASANKAWGDFEKLMEAQREQEV